MKTYEIIMAGFGGQGVMSMGMLMTYSGMEHGLNVSWVPSYGPEQRGGTANCSVVIGDEPIGSPVVTEPNAAVVMNTPSMRKFAPRMTDGGLLLLNSSLVDERPERSELRVFEIPADEIARELGNERVSNMVITGALVEAMDGDIDLEVVKDCLKKVLPSHRHDLIPLNHDALDRGADLMQELRASV
jgi:2-oxoglutarate ferredoxin oxidoreductase subunit gamma